MSIQYIVPGYEPTTFTTWVSSHNHYTRDPALLIFFKVWMPTYAWRRRKKHRRQKCSRTLSRSSDPELKVLSGPEASFLRFPDPELEVAVGVVSHGPATVADFLQDCFADSHSLIGSGLQKLLLLLLGSGVLPNSELKVVLSLERSSRRSRHCRLTISVHLHPVCQPGTNTIKLFLP